MNIIRVLAVTLMIAQYLVHTSCQNGKAPGTASDSLRVGIAYSTSGKHDNSYGEQAARGLADLRKEKPALDVREVEPKSAMELESSLEALARAGCSLIIAVGPFYSQPAATVAGRHPDVDFVVIDGDLPAGSPPNNLRAVVFRAEQGSFLVGVIAGLKAKEQQRDAVGVVAGMDIPVINRFVRGYECGVKAVLPEARVLKAYVGSGPEAFNNPALAETLAVQQIGQGAEVLFHVAGASGDGVIRGAARNNKFAIGVDRDQSDLSPQHVLTSMIKRVDLAVRNVINERLETKSRLKPGAVEVGISPSQEYDFVGYFDDEKNDPIFPRDTSQLQSLREAIKGNKIQIPSSVDQPCPAVP
jgi:basic membrane protein A